MRPAPSLSDRLTWAFEARPTWGEIRVVPAFDLHDPIEVNLTSYLGRALPQPQRQARLERTQQLDRVPGALGLALPGEVNGVLGLAWAGQFRGHALPTSAGIRIRDALTGRRPDLHATLASGAREVGGHATLFSWVLRLRGDPLSLRAFPGEVVETELGPVVLDQDDEPYLVEAEVGMALVTEDGEVVLRYQDTYYALLSGEEGTGDAARSLARALAEEVALVWSLDPRLGESPPRKLDTRRPRTRWLPAFAPSAVADR